MAHKRKAQEAFGMETVAIPGQSTMSSLTTADPVSAFAAARQARQSRPGSEPEPGSAPASPLAASIAAEPYDTPNPQLDPPTSTPVKPSVRLSNLSPGAVLEKAGGDLEISLHADQSFTLIGEYEIVVLQGAVTIHGSVLHPSSGTQTVFALTTSALPAVVARKNGSLVQVGTLRPQASRISCLGQCSPLFRNIGSVTGNGKQSFALLMSSVDDPLQRSVSPLVIDEDIRKALSRINARLEANECPRIMAIGAKSSGKSTFNRLACNLMTSRSVDQLCLYLDLDPGQPEFGAPGQVSLVEVRAPLLGPSFTHPATVDSKDFRIIKSHTIAATSFKNDPELYLHCAVDLSMYVAPNVPMIVNTCGWVNGLGGTIIRKLAASLHLTDIPMLHPIDNALEEDLSTNVSTHHIRRQQSRATTQKTPAETRAMQTMSYFHQRHRSKHVGLEWNSQAISTIRPWSVSYAGDRPGVTAILLYDQMPDPNFLVEVLNGMVVAVVVLETELPDLGAVQRTVKEDLPFIALDSRGHHLFLDPGHSRCIGLALIRGIDAVKKRLDIVTPLNESQIMHLLTSRVVLVKGTFEPPEWAYLEDAHAKSGHLASNGYGERPWVTPTEPVGIEGSVWRLRHPPTMADARNAP